MNDVIQLNASEIEELKKYLLSKSLDYHEKPNYVMYKGKDIVISIYSSGKVLFQGKESQAFFKDVNEFFNKDVAENNLSSSEQINIDVIPRIGTDESGKGDFFGPLVTTGFLINSKDMEDKLKEIGVTDSKKLSENRINELAQTLKTLNMHNTVMIWPQKYNELYSKLTNINRILAWSHARVIENLLGRFECPLAISDQFGDKSLIETALLKQGKKIELIQMHKAESNLAVAAASIIARAEFTERLKQLETKYNTRLSKGASEKVILDGVEFARNLGKGSLSEVAKIHFKTYNDIIAKL